MTGHYNSLVGNSTGVANTTGVHLSFFGFEAGKSNTSGGYNTAIGSQALYSNPTLFYNTAIGYQAMYSTSTCPLCYQDANGIYSYNTAVGYQALYSTRAYGGCALGFLAAYSNRDGCSIVAIGEEAARYNTDGNDNNAVGEAALRFNTSLSDNVAIGTHALGSQSRDPGCDGAGHCLSSNNVAVGNYALNTNDPTRDDNGIDNTAIGRDALYSNSTGAYNVASGYQASFSNDVGKYNVSSGFQSGYSNLYGNYNVCEGVNAGYNNQQGYSTFIGAVAGAANTTGDYNTFVGYGSGNVNSTASNNTGVGLSSLVANTTGGNNSGLGLQVLGQTTTGSSIAGLGYKAGYTNTTGTKNTFIGANADANAGNLNDAGAFGYNTVVTASNKFFFGDAAVVGCYNASNVWGTYSDGRFKINVQENVSGLDFIKRLRPVTYNMNAQALDSFLHQNSQPSMDSSGNVIAKTPEDFTAATNIIHSGFIAQEVEQASLASGFTSSIVSAPSNANEPYALNYQEFVVPLVKSIQQLDSINQLLASRDSVLENRVTSLEQIINNCCGQNNRPSGSQLQNQIKNESIQQQNIGTNEFPVKQAVDLASSSPILYQNQPNPFDHSTTIRYFIPDNANQPKIIFQDETGRTIKEISITEKGQASILVNAELLNAGIYTYSLQIAGKIVDSLKMIKSK